MDNNPWQRSLPWQSNFEFHLERNSAYGKCKMKKKNILDFYHYWLDWKFSAKITSAILNVTLLSIVALVITYYITNVNQTAEQTGEQLLILGDQTMMRTAERISESVKILETLAKTPSIVAAVKDANKARVNWTPDLITQLDKAWVEKDPAIKQP
jgi:hypothetical protein